MRARAVLALAASLSLIGAGCGGGEETATTSSAASTTTDAAAPEALGATFVQAPDGEDGALVESVQVPTTRLKEGDLVTEIDGKAIATPDELIEAAEAQKPGQTVAIAVTRDGKTFQLQITAAVSTYLGVEVKDAKEGAGATVVTVQPDSPAEEAGVKEGDVVTAVDDDAVTGGDLASVVGTHDPGDEVTISLTRDSEDLELTATLAENPAIK